MAVLTLKVVNWMAFFSVVLVSGQRRQQQLALTASFPFRMVLSPTALELKTAALRKIQLAMTQHMLEYSRSFASKDTFIIATVEVFIHKDEFVPDLLATHIVFFALATFRTHTTEHTTEEASTESERQSSLNTLVQEAFSSADRRAIFVQRLQALVQDFRDDVWTNQTETLEQFRILQELLLVSVHPFTSLSPLSEEGSTNQVTWISTLDIVLIIISLTILVGILWMIVEHYKDRGYIENQRRQFLNSSKPSRFSIPRQYFEDGDDINEDTSAIESLSSAGTSHLTVYDNRSIIDSKDVFIHSDPSTSSTLANSMVSFEKRLPYSNDNIIVNTKAFVSSHDPSNLLPPYATDSDEESEALAEFENNWFRRRSTALVDNRTKQPNICNSLSYDDQSSEDDVFCVDMSKTVSESTFTEYSITEWMRSIQVNPSNKKSATKSIETAVDLTTFSNKKSNHYSDSISSNLLEVTPTENQSLEHSMASDESDSSSSAIKNM